MDISSFDDLLHAARAQPEPQRLLFVFAAAELPDDATPAQRARFAAGQGGAGGSEAGAVGVLAAGSVALAASVAPGASMGAACSLRDLSEKRSGCRPWAVMAPVLRCARVPTRKALISWRAS